MQKTGQNFFFILLILGFMLGVAVNTNAIIIVVKESSRIFI